MHAIGCFYVETKIKIKVKGICMGMRILLISIQHVTAPLLSLACMIGLHPYIPCIEFCLTSCAQSSNVSVGISSRLAPSGSRRYTCALDMSSTWNLRKEVRGMYVHVCTCLSSYVPNLLYLYLLAAYLSRLLRFLACDQGRQASGMRLHVCASQDIKYAGANLAILQFAVLCDAVIALLIAHAPSRLGQVLPPADC